MTVELLIVRIVIVILYKDNQFECNNPVKFKYVILPNKIIGWEIKIMIGTHDEVNMINNTVARTHQEFPLHSF